MPEDVRPRSIGRRSRRSMCGGSFGVIRYHFGPAEFCSKRCLNRFLSNRTDRPTSLKEWIEEVRKGRGT
jgi:hypothetical protein